MKLQQIKSRILLLLPVLPVILLPALLLCGCGEDTAWLWSRDETADTDSLREETVIRVTDAETGVPVPPAEPDSNPDTEADGGTSAEPGTETVSASDTAPETAPGESDCPETQTEPASDTFAPVTDPPAEPVTEPDTEAATEAPGTVYTGEAHPGTDIYYVGTGENASRIIVIDAGHQKVGSNEKEPVGPGSEVLKGKVSYGTTGSFTGICEYELTLQVALRLRDVLLARGYSVVMIRETNDVDISNVGRAQIANAYRADCFIRLHANGWTDENVQGGMAMCQTAQNPFPACAAHYAESRLLAESVFAAFRDATGIGTYHGGLWESDDQSGTNWSEVPTTILEMGFMTNRADDELMATDSFRDNAARGIADGIEQYLAALSVNRGR